MARRRTPESFWMLSKASRCDDLASFCWNHRHKATVVFLAVPLAVFLVVFPSLHSGYRLVCTALCTLYNEPIADILASLDHIASELPASCFSPNQKIRRVRVLQISRCADLSKSFQIFPNNNALNCSLSSTIISLFGVSDNFSGIIIQKKSEEKQKISICVFLDRDLEQF